MAETTHGRIDARHAYVLICGIGVVLAFASTLTILSFASRAFAFYNFLQCLVAISVSKSTTQKAAIGVLAAALAFITLFAVPAGWHCVANQESGRHMSSLDSAKRS
jgi:hypothetical protein